MSAAAPRYSDTVLALFRELPGAGELRPGPGKVVAGEAIALERDRQRVFEVVPHGMQAVRERMRRVSG